MPMQKKKAFDAISMVASGLRDATGNATAVRLQQMANAFAFTLDVTVDESTAADKLDVFVQTKADGTNWLDVVHFPQHDGDAGAERYVEKVTASPSVAGFLTSAALGVGTVRDIVGDDWRVRWVVIDDSGSAAYTFSVQACPM